MQPTRQTYRLVLALTFGLTLVMLAAGVASARPGQALLPAQDGLRAPARSEAAILPLTYAYVVTANVPVYASPTDEVAGVPPVRSLGSGYLWVSLADTRPVVQDGQTWYRINAGEYVRADNLAVYRPSAFQGVTLDANPELPFAWMVYSVQASAEPGEKPDTDAPLLKRYTLVTIYEEQMVDDLAWYRVGDGQWIEQRNVGLVRLSPRPEGVGANEKWIDVNLFEQTLVAYEGDRMVYATLVSTGLPYWKTEEGLFRVWAKVTLGKMSGREGFADYYYLEDVPWTVYFNRAFALHAAYWHDRFGFPHSHGCVNLAPQDAQWLFDWATPESKPSGWTMSTPENPGTWVWVHDR